MITIFRFLLKFWLRGTDANTSKTIGLVLDTTASHKALVAVVMILNIATAFFEGSSMVVFAMAVATIVGQEATSLESSLGAAGAFVDGFRGAMSRENFFLVLIGFGIVGQLLRSGLQYCSSAAGAFLQVRVRGDLQRKTIHKIFTLSYSEVNKYATGTLSAYAGQAGQTAALVGKLNSLFCDLLMALSYVAVLIWVSWQMTLGALILIVVFSLVITRVVQPLRVLGERTVKAGIAMNRSMVGFIQASRLVHVFGRESYVVKRITDSMEEGLLAIRQGSLLKASITPILESLTIVLAAAFLVGGYLLSSGSTESVLSSMLAFILVLNRLMPKVTNLNRMRAGFIQMLPAARKMAELFVKGADQYKRKGGFAVERINDAIAFENVTFQFSSRGEDVIKNVSFRVAAGEVLAVVGQSGAGKSTLVDLLLGLYSPTDGRILVDGVDLEEVDLGSWRDQIGVVDQDVFLLNENVRDNISFGKLDASFEEIAQAARDAYADEFISGMPQGYETVLGERGHGLSGGQKQRLAFARAIVRSPQLLVLDEATSALDSESERLIQRTIREQSGQKTVVIIAHRLSTLAHADQIIVLDGGSIVEQGTHQSLIKKSGIYSKLWRLQSSIEREEKLTA